MTPRIVVRAGTPTAEDLAVVAAVLLGRAAATASGSGGPSTPPWARAARLEALGRGPIMSAVDLRLQPRA